MLRRRALWERDSSSRLSWPWKLSSRWLGAQQPATQHLSSTHSSRPKADEGRERGSWKDSPLTTFHKDFESFKQAVDRAIERDPYGTLFGRRLQSPPSVNNSSWTTFSWIFDPKEIKEEKSAKERQLSSSPTSTSPDHARTPEPIPHTKDQIFQASQIPNSQVVEAEEYEYDPISMRKVPKIRSDPRNSSTEPSNPSPKSSKPAQAESTLKAEGSEPPRKTFFEALFGEHGVDIPVKTYKPHKVYGYGLEEKNNKVTDTKSAKKNAEFETSRKREFMALKAAKLGNTIDTTAEYGGKYAVEDLTPSEPAKRPRGQSQPSDDAPLFSGTTYEGRSRQTSPPQSAQSEWLRKEGFSVEPKDSTDPVNIPLKKSMLNAESSRDQKPQQPTKIERPSSNRLEFALDRQIRSSAQRISPLEKASSSQATASEKAEDIDLLRASDVRAAARSARVSKQEKAERKVEARKKLEEDFSTQQTQEETNQPFASYTPKSAVAQSLDNVQRHVQNYPDGIVARTVKSMGMFNENWKKYVRPEPKVDLNKPLKFKDDTLSNVASIHKPRRNVSKSISFMPSIEVVEAELLSQQRTRALENGKALAKEKASREDAEANELAKHLKREYEEEYGSINAQHRQTKQNTQSSSSQDTLEPKRHPLSTASVKPGVNINPVIQSHVSKFEPELSRLVQESKEVRRVLHDTGNHIRQLKQRIAQKPWTAIDAANTSSIQPDLTNAEASLSRGLDKSAVSQPITTVQEPVFTPDGSPIWNDEQPPTVSELRKAFTAPFVILKYDRDTGTVNRLTSQFRYDETSKQRPSSLKILAQLQNAEKFYPYFATLEYENYEIISSGADTLIFQKASPTTTARREADEETHRQADLQRAIEQDVKQVIPDEPQPSQQDSIIQTATVLDEIPIDNEPSPGPAAPTAPPYTPTSKPAPTSDPASTPKPRVKRQEDVFSGTRTSRAGPQVTSRIDPETASPLPSDNRTADSNPRASIVKRFFRTVKRVILTTLTLGVGAYVVGVITEGLDAKNQQSAVKGEIGPRRKVVLPAVDKEGRAEWTGRRRGIYSTEDSR